MDHIPRLTIEAIQRRLGVGQPHPQYALHQFDAACWPQFGTCRMEAHFIALLHQGELVIEANLQVQRLVAPAIYAMSPAVLRRFEAGSADSRSEVIFFDEAFLLQPLADTGHLRQFGFFHGPDQHLLALQPAQYREVAAFFGLLRQQAEKSGPHRAAGMRHALHLLLHELAALALPAAPAGPASHGALVAATFRQQVERYFRIERKVSYYAGLQCLSPKHFSTLLRQQTGKTAGQWIDERVVLEARCLLHHAALSVGQVAQQLGFDDAANFGKYFRNLTGQSPRQFQREARQ